MPQHAKAGIPTSVYLHAPWPIPPDTALTPRCAGRRPCEAFVAERAQPTVSIEARFAVRLAGEYNLTVDDRSTRPRSSATSSA